MGSRRSLRHCFISFISVSSLVVVGLEVALAARPVPTTEPVPQTAAAPVAVFLVRHAEKAAEGGEDPGLSERGRARAEALATLLSRAHVTHLFASEFKRAVETLAPLAKRTALEVTTIPAKDAARQLGALRALPAGSVAVVAGHSNTIPGLVCDLGSGRAPAELDCSPAGRRLPEDAYDRLFLVLLPRVERGGIDGSGTVGGKDRIGATLTLTYGDRAAFCRSPARRAARSSRARASAGRPSLA